jgi:predicted ATPase/transcriptional regulator with XRE-family HTH domain/Tfp pilus assembly protein PilF
MNDDIPFGLWLKQRRIALNLARKELAQLMGYSVETIAKIESGERRPTIHVAELLAEHLRIPPGERSTFISFATAAWQGLGLAPGLPVHVGLTTSERAPSQLHHYPNNLPAQLNPFIGRESEVRTVGSLARRVGVRLLTLVGAPGIGKTRLALQSATHLLEEFEHGVYFITLAPIADPHLIVPTIGRTLGLREAVGGTMLDSLKDYLGPKRMLVVLDNFEHLLSGAPVVAELLEAAEGLKMLVTSRAALRLYGEYEFPVPPLSLPGLENPPSIQGLAEYEAIALFLERALAARSDFRLDGNNASAVTEICRRLDGLPLPIELAAARVRFESPQGILEQMEQAKSTLDVLVAYPFNLPERHLTLRNAIAWSYNLLDANEQKLFRAASVFAGGCTAEGAAAVSGVVDVADTSEVLSSLAAKSLLFIEEADGEPRFGMLETIHEYGLERVSEEGEAEAALRQHAYYYLDLAERADQHLRGPDQDVWLNRLEKEHNNLRTALRWAEESGEWETGLRIAIALRQFWDIRGYLSEGRKHLEKMLAKLQSNDQRSVIYAKGLQAIAMLAIRQADFGWARTPLEESLNIFRLLSQSENEDLRIVGQWGVAESLSQLGIVDFHLGNYLLARSHYEESLSIRRNLGDAPGAARTLNNLGLMAIAQGEYILARSLFEESLATRRELGDKRGTAMTLTNLANTYYYLGDYISAYPLYGEALIIRRELGDKLGIAMSRSNLGSVAYAQGDYARARSLYEEALQTSSEVGDKDAMAISLHNLASVEYKLGDAKEARRLFGHTLDIAQQIGDKKRLASCIAGFALVAGMHGDAERAATLFGAAESLLDFIGAVPDRLDRADYDSSMAALQDQIDTDVWNAAYEKGKALTMEQAITFALEQPTESSGPSAGGS